MNAQTGRYARLRGLMRARQRGTYYIKEDKHNTMSVKVEKLENNMAKITIEVPVINLEEAINKVFLKARGRISVPGFRKGKAPRKIIEQMYGKGVFLEDAANDLIPDEYSKALKEIEEVVVSRPKIDVDQLEPGKPFIFTAEVALKPEVTLGEYKGLEVPVFDTEVSDEDVLEEIKKEQEKNSRTITVERAAENGDIVTIDFTGYVDDEPFEGGEGEDYPLTLGSGTFIPGFEEQLIGAKEGDHVAVTVTFPEEYQADNLAGKEAVFQCDVKKVETKELPELDDDFAQDVSDFDTLDEYKASVRENLEKEKAENALREKEDAAVDKAIKNAQMDIPQAMIDTQAENMLDNYAQRLQAQGLSLEQYFMYTGQSMDSMLESLKPQALKTIQTRLILEAIAAAENIEVTDEEINEEIGKMAENYGLEAEGMRDMMGEDELDSLKKDIAVQKAVTLLADTAVETENAGNDEEPAAEDAE